MDRKGSTKEGPNWRSKSSSHLPRSWTILSPLYIGVFNDLYGSEEQSRGDTILGVETSGKAEAQGNEGTGPRQQVCSRLRSGLDCSNFPHVCPLAWGFLMPTLVVFTLVKICLSLFYWVLTTSPVTRERIRGWLHICSLFFLQISKTEWQWKPSNI